MRPRSLSAVAGAFAAALVLSAVAGANGSPHHQGSPSADAAPYTLMGDATNTGSDLTNFISTYGNPFSGAWYFESSSETAGAISLYSVQETSANGVAVLAEAEGTGVRGSHLNGTGTGPGVYGTTASGDDLATGVLGEVFDPTPGASSAAVRGLNGGTDANGIGVWGSQNGSGRGVSGTVTGAGRGVSGSSSGGDAVFGSDATGHGGNFSSTSGTGVIAASTSGSAVNAASESGRAIVAAHTGFSGGIPTVDATTNSTDPNGSAVKGNNFSANSGGVGVWGNHAGFGWGVYGFSSSGTGVVGQSNTGFAGYFLGNVHVQGTLSKTAGSFQIDNPLNPSKEYLQHSFVESPDMMNVYNGNATTDADGFATVKLPGYFQALNKDFRYQLTVVGRSFARAIVWNKIANNRFTIRTDEPQVEVSWQVTGVRHDPYANAHRIKTIVKKPTAEQGLYVYPQGYGQPETKSVFAAQMHGQVAKHQRTFFHK